VLLNWHPCETFLELKVSTSSRSECQLYAAISRLDESEQRLIGELYFAEKTQLQLSHEIGIPQQTISFRAKKALVKLRNRLAET